MALTPRLDLRQTQSLVMTPQLQQAIKLLQLSSLELSAYIESQLEQNPLLERDDSPQDGFEPLPSEPADTTLEPAAVREELRRVDEAVDAHGATDFADAALDLDYYDNLFDADAPGNASGVIGPAGSSSQSGRGGSFEEHDTNFEEVLASRPTLKEHLLSQLAVDLDDPVDRIIGAVLIDMLDESGYLPADLSSVAALLNCSLTRVEATLRVVQRFDPPGVFARSLAECLALQLQDRGCLDASMRLLLDHLDLVGKRDWAALSRVVGVSGEKLTRLVLELRSLDPKPALAFDDTVARAVTPDVLMRAHPNGGWIVELNAETLPRVLVNNQYYTQLSRSLRTREDKQYVNECLQSANWLVRSLHQRATTILKVATEIVRQQHGFFERGIPSLKPLVLRDIADAIGMHESTVSRVTANKYVSTPRGIFELKYFFTHAIGSGADAHSAESVRYRIRALIDSEAGDAVLSDDALVEELRREGIGIARRTVAKYREAMNIPSSVQRRREKSGGF